jgi:hypothetical protein
MEQTQYPSSENSQLGRLVADALVEIERLGDSARSLNRSRAIWEHLIEFARRKGLGVSGAASRQERVGGGGVMAGVGMWSSAKVLDRFR